MQFDEEKEEEGEEKRVSEWDICLSDLEERRRYHISRRRSKWKRKRRRRKRRKRRRKRRRRWRWRSKRRTRSKKRGGG